MSAPAPAFRNTNPDELDLMLRVSSPMGWLVLAVLACVVAGGLAWSVLGTAPIKVSGTGVLQGAGGVLLVSAPGSGPVSELKVAVGERVAAGAIVAVLSDPVLEARAQTISTRLAQLQEEQRKLATFQAREMDVRARADAQRKEALENTIRQAREREAALAQMLANQRDLLSRGLATRDRVLLTENDREQARRDAADAANAINALGVDADERGIRSEREMLELLARISQSQQELAEVEAERAARTLVRAPVSGRIIDAFSGAGGQGDCRKRPHAARAGNLRRGHGRTCGHPVRALRRRQEGAARHARASGALHREP